jgi:hypothetical protein
MESELIYLQSMIDQPGKVDWAAGELPAIGRDIFTL